MARQVLHQTLPCSVHMAPRVCSLVLSSLLLVYTPEKGAIHEKKIIKEEREKEDNREAGSVDQWPA